MLRLSHGRSFSSLFKKYRLRSEIETLSEFGDLLAEEGLVYETSLFTRWQNGERSPSSRKIIIVLVNLFVKRGGIKSIIEANKLLESLDYRDLSKPECVEVLSKLEPPTISNLPEDFDLFIGREQLLKDIGWKLIHKKKVLICGLPGIGKTYIAIHLGHVLKSLFVDGVYFFRVDLQNLNNILDEILKALGNDMREVYETEVKLERLKNLIQERNIILILDNINNNQLNSLIVSFLCSLSIPILFTSIEEIKLDRIEMVKIINFTRSEYLDLAEKLLGKPFIEVNKSEIDGVGELLEYLPISSTIVLKQIYSNPQQVCNYVSLIQKKYEDLSNVTYDNKNLFVALEFAFNKLSIYLQNLLISCAAFNGKDFSKKHVKVLNNITKQKNNYYFNELIKFSFIEFSVKGRYRLHPAVKIFLNKKVTKKLKLFLAEYYLQKLKKFPIGSNKYIRFLNEEVENIICSMAVCYELERYKTVTDLWQYCNTYIFDCGQWDQLHRLDKLIQNSYKQTNNYKELGIYLIEDLARMYFYQSNLKKVNKLFVISSRIAFKYNFNLLNGLIIQKYGIVHTFNNNFDEAERQLLKSLEILKKENARKDQILKSYAYLGLLYAKMLKNNKAVEHLTFALKKSRQLSDITITNYIYIYLGQAYLSLDKCSLAEKFFIKGYLLSNKRSFLIGKAMTLHGLGEISYKSSKFDIAKKYYFKALFLYKNLKMENECKSIEAKLTNY